MKYMNEDDELHRVNGPALENADDDYSWWYNGQRHRYYGSAWCWHRGVYEYWIFDERVR